MRTSEHKAGVQLLVVSRIGFLKATKVCPAVAVKLLWNLATALSWKFTLRNQRLRELGATIEAQRRKSARQEETAQLKDAAAKLDTLVRGSKAVYSLRASSKWHETMSAPPPSSAAAPTENAGFAQNLFRGYKAWNVSYREGRVSGTSGFWFRL